MKQPHTQTYIQIASIIKPTYMLQIINGNAKS